MKKKLTLSIDAEITEQAKIKASKSGISLSKLVENALKYYVNPTVYCFKCGTRFSINETEVCPKCGWYVCPHCGACACSLGEEGVKVAFYMRRTLKEVFLSDEV